MRRKIGRSVNRNLYLLGVVYFGVYLFLLLAVSAESGHILERSATGIKILLLGIPGIIGLACFVFVSRRISGIARDIRASEELIKEQNIKLIKKSIELSDVMRRYEDKNYDLEMSSAKLNRMLSVLQEQAQDRRIMFDNSPLGIIRFDTRGTIIDFNDKFVDQMGASREKLMGFNTAERSTPEMSATLKKALKGVESVFEGEYTSVTGNKTSYFRVVFNPVTPGQSPTQVIATIEDITKRRQAEDQLQESHIKLERLVRERTARLIQKIDELEKIEEALRKSEEKYRSILESIDDVYFETDLKGRLTFFNNAMTELLGYAESELVHMKYKTFTDPENQKKLFDAFSTVYRTGQGSPVVHCGVISRDQRRLELSFRISLMKDKDGQASGFQGLARDVTQQRAMEARLQQSQKMEAIGSLAGGVAHDFNNLLGAIVGYTQLVKTHKDESDRVQAYAEQILKAGERAAALVQQILLFSRKTKAQKIPSDLGIVAKEVLKLLRASIPSTIEIHHRIDLELNTVMADQTQIHQVLMNLCSNAAHAMPEGGILAIRLRNLWVDAANADRHYELDMGHYIHLSVSDTGAGMTGETLKKIFDPYFTTKEAGEGTGLGLATVHGIIKDHEGIILIHSEVDTGTKCDIFLPAIDRTAEPDVKPAEMPGGKERILFVDDEAYLTEVGKEMLQDFGYAVDTFTSPKAALAAYENNPAQYDLVITDYTMPEMNGEQMARKILEIRPVPVIMCTGITLGLKIGEESGIKAVLMKPLEMENLLQAIRQLLDAGD